MVSLKIQLNQLIRMVGSSLFLRLLSFVAFLVPSCGNWMKRLFFILTLYHELQRQKVFSDFTLWKLNDKMLKLKEPSVLSNVSEIAQLNLTRYDWDIIRGKGIDIDAIINNRTISLPEAEIISDVIASNTPSGLNYGQVAMKQDIIRLLTQINAQVA